MPQLHNIFQSVCLCMESKAFKKSPKFTCSGLLNSAHCSMTVLRVKIWSVQPLPARNSACSSLSFVSIYLSILFEITLHRTLLGIELFLSNCPIFLLFCNYFFCKRNKQKFKSNFFVITKLNLDICVYVDSIIFANYDK